MTLIDLCKQTNLRNGMWVHQPTETTARTFMELADLLSVSTDLESVNQLLIYVATDYIDDRRVK